MSMGGGAERANYALVPAARRVPFGYWEAKGAALGTRQGHDVPAPTVFPVGTTLH